MLRHIKKLTWQEHHYELIRRYVNSSSLPHIEVLRTALATIWGEDCRAGGENIIKMFPVRVINAGAPATLRFLQQHLFDSCRICQHCCL